MLNDVPCLGRPAEIDNDQIKILLENNQCYFIQYNVGNRGDI